MGKSRTYLICIALVISAGFTFVDNEIINEIVVKLMEFSTNNYQEKIYVSTDTDLYYAGDVVWINTRLLDAQSHTPSMLSRVAHVKLFNSNNKELYHKKILVTDGAGYADFLLSDTLSTGVYHISGYTQWMKNFSQEFFFLKKIYIVNQPINLSDCQHEKEEKINVHFFPEGGTFISSMDNKVGFEITDVLGRGKKASGYILDDRGDTIVHTSTYKFGLGSFLINPKKGRNYFLYIESNKVVTKHMLPSATENGLNLTVLLDTLENVEVELESSRKFKINNKKLILLVQCRGKVQFAAEGEVARKNIIKISNSKLGEGINQLTVFDEKGVPLVERLIFIRPKYVSGLTITNLKSTYSKRERVNLELASEVNEDIDITISVHDRPPMSSNNIVNNLLLSSELKGTIEDPGYYFNDTDSARRATDNLMLTHGWRRFVWDDVLKDDSTEKVYSPEKDGLTFRGKLINKLTDKPVKDTVVVMSILNKSPNILFSWLLNKDEFVFDLPELFGTQKVFVNVLENNDLNNYKLVPSSLYDTFKLEISKPSCLKTEMLRIDRGHFELKKTEQLILNNYRVYKPKIFKVSSSQLGKDDFFESQYLEDPQHKLYLNKYKPLKDFKEVVFELMPSAKIKRKKGKDKLFVLNESSEVPFEVYSDHPHSFYEKSATFFVNGVPIFDDNYVFNMDYSNLYKVEMFNGHTFKFIDYKFYGVVAITTQKFHFQERTELEGFSNFYQLEGLSTKREFYPLSDKTGFDTRLPYINHLLYWNPNIHVEKGNASKLSFSTSDAQNNFYVKVEGITKSGKPISLIKEFRVK